MPIPEDLQGLTRNKSFPVEGRRREVLSRLVWKRVTGMGVWFTKERVYLFFYRKVPQTFRKGFIFPHGQDLISSGSHAGRVSSPWFFPYVMKGLRLLLLPG